MGGGGEGGVATIPESVIELIVSQLLVVLGILIGEFVNLGGRGGGGGRELGSDEGKGEESGIIGEGVSKHILLTRLL